MSPNPNETISYTDHDKGITLSVPLTVKNSYLWYLLVTAFESGSEGTGSWAQITGYTIPTTLIQYDASMTKPVKYADYPLSPGGAVLLADNEDEDVKFTLDYAAIERGLKVMCEKYPKHWKDLIEDNHDAITADVLVQCALLGEVQYG